MTEAGISAMYRVLAIAKYDDRYVIPTGDRAHKAASLLLGYADQQLFDQLPLITDSVATLPDDLGQPRQPFVEHLSATPPTSAQQDYVATFDLRPRC
jgi:nitrate reductase molybdenum cofactor assembly chaperone NarJ/NarW